MSSYYRKIFPRIWNDERFSTLTGEQQRIALYILTAQSNRIGLFSFSPGKASEELHLSPRAFNKAFLHVCKTLNWQWDPVARVLYLPTWWRYNQPESGNNMKGNLKDIVDLPTTTLLAQFAENTTDLSEDIKPTFIEALAQALAKGYPNPSPHPSPTQNQDQKQEQKQEQEQDQNAPPPPDSFFLVEEVKDRWNQIPGVRRCEAIEGALKLTLEEYCRTKPKAWWETLFELVTNARCLTGRTAALEGREPFQADLNWIMNNLESIFSGRYCDGASPGQCQNTVRRNGQEKSVLCLEHIHVPIKGDPASPKPYCLNCYHTWLEREEAERRERERSRLSFEEQRKQQAERRARPPWQQDQEEIS